jgi:hypothetical protein
VTAPGGHGLAVGIAESVVSFVLSPLVIPPVLVEVTATAKGSKG